MQSGGERQPQAEGSQENPYSTWRVRSTVGCQGSGLGGIPARNRVGRPCGLTTQRPWGGAEFPGVNGPGRRRVAQVQVMGLGEFRGSGDTRPPPAWGSLGSGLVQTRGSHLF